MFNTIDVLTFHHFEENSSKCFVIHALQTVQKHVHLTLKVSQINETLQHMKYVACLKNCAHRQELSKHNFLKNIVNTNLFGWCKKMCKSVRTHLYLLFYIILPLQRYIQFND